MSARARGTGRAFVAAALATAENWLLEPAAPAPESSPVPLASRPVVAVFGLGSRSGATMVARALGAELGARDAVGASAVSGAGPQGAVPLGTAAAVRLTRELAPSVPGRTRAAGRLCLVETSDLLPLAEAARARAPLVLDAGRAPGGTAASLADRVVLVASPGVEPALAPVVAAAVERLGRAPLVVINRTRAGDDAGWDRRADVRLPESRAGARLALSGREPRGGLGRAVADLADRC